MINPKDNSQTSIIERAADYQPPRTLRSWLIGRPLSTADASHQTIGKLVGLAVFASDALSSTAYATQEILVILAAAGTAAFGIVFPISIAIVVLLGIVTISYEQTIHAYPDGGGAYIVARDNLGEFPALIAGASFLDVVFLLLRGDRPNDRERAMLEAMLVAVCDHGEEPPSTAAAHTSASTGNGLHVAIAAGLLAMGPKHGCAVSAAMGIFSRGESPESIVHEAIADGQRLPGF
ncbi:MAG: hypothetical protein HYU84_12030, partial [Chloroflexi bacterium]|nr:hypothetical protein [Chloroflexota bacterium]